MIKTYEFSNTPLHDLKTQSLVYIDGERDVEIKSYGNLVFAFILSKKIIAEIQVDHNFDYNAYLIELRKSGFFHEVVCEFIVSADELYTSSAQPGDKL